MTTHWISGLNFTQFFLQNNSSNLILIKKYKNTDLIQPVVPINYQFIFITGKGLI